MQKTKVYAHYGVPEYWFVDLKNFTLEQYLLRGNVYELAEVYVGGEPVRSERLDCVSFTMNDLTRDLQPEWAE